MRRWVVAVVVAVLAGATAGCGGGSKGSKASGGSGHAAPTVAADELRIGAGEDIWPLTGAGPSSKAFAAGELSVGVYEPLLTLGPDYSVRPGLATAWELVNPTTWRFHLRPGVHFHDGRPFGADDVVWSWTGRQFYPGAVANNLSAVTKVDDLTVDFVMTAPDLRLPEQLVHPEGPIVPRNSNNDASPPVGTGPFRVVEYKPRQRVVVERFDGYWGDKPKLRRLTFEFLPDPAARVDALRNGDVDLALNLPWDAVASIEADAKLRVVKAPAGATQSVSFAINGKPPYDVTADKAVRQAVALALDRAAYVSEVLKGNGEPGHWLSPPAVLGAAASTVGTVPFDPARARSVLDDAGWKAGADGIRAKGSRRLTLTLVGGPAVPDAGLRFVQSRLKDVGIEVALKKANDTVTYQDYRDKGYDLDLTMPNQNDANPAFLPAGRSSPELATAALTADTREAAQAVAARMTQAQVVDDMVTVPLAHVARIFGMRRGVDIGTPHPSAINQSWVGLAVTR